MSTANETPQQAGHNVWDYFHPLASSQCKRIGWRQGDAMYGGCTSGYPRGANTPSLCYFALPGLSNYLNTDMNGGDTYSN